MKIIKFLVDFLETLESGHIFSTKVQDSRFQLCKNTLKPAPLKCYHKKFPMVNTTSKMLNSPFKLPKHSPPHILLCHA